jgi:RNA polymerase sigma-70 factor (ECF subfamily)
MDSVATLLSQARAGDTAALDRLFGLCRNFVGVVAQAQVDSWLRAKVDASDLVQQSLLEAYQGFGGFHGGTEAEWLAWLKRIVGRNAADFVRHYQGAAKRQASREVALESPTGFPVATPAGGSQETPSRELIKRERELAVADALAHLPADYQEVIRLRNFQRLPFDEVARRMDRSRPAAQMLWLRAIQRLKDELAELS